MVIARTPARGGRRSNPSAGASVLDALRHCERSEAIQCGRLMFQASEHAPGSRRERDLALTLPPGCAGRAPPSPQMGEGLNIALLPLSLQGSFGSVMPPA